MIHLPMALELLVLFIMLNSLAVAIEVVLAIILGRTRPSTPPLPGAFIVQYIPEFLLVDAVGRLLLMVVMVALWSPL